MAPPTHTLTTVERQWGELKPHPRNARNGDVDAIAESLRVNGQYRPIVTTWDGTILAGNHTYMAAGQLGWTSLACVVLDVDPDSSEAHRIMLADNRTADLGGYDGGVLLSLLQGLDDTVGLLGSGYDEHALEHLLHIEEQFYDEPVPKDVPAPRQATIDLIYSAVDWPTSLAAHLVGWQQGYISTSLPGAFDRLQEATASMRDKPVVTFIDNEYRAYNHDEHVAAVRRYSPKYATTRDLMTKQQCADAGAAYFTVDEVLAQAEDVAEAGAGHVILIPKFDCLDDLPRTIGGKPVVLGYSVPSSYGRTNLDPERFKGWPVHLLGGSWKTQRGLCAILGDDVVALDNNYLYKQAMHGVVETRAGQRPLTALGDFTVRKGLPLICTMLSLAACLDDVISWGGAAPDEAPPIPETIEGDER